MQLNEKTRATLDVMLSRRVPEDVYFDIDNEGSVRAQAKDQDAVRRFRAAFPGIVWKKSFSEGCNWWEYDGTAPEGFAINIYACSEAPPTCKAIEEEYEAEERVPVRFETRTVTKKRVRWDCGADEVSE